MIAHDMTLSPWGTALEGSAPSQAGDSPGVRFAEAWAFSLLIALGAQLAIPLPWTPVPITGQTLFVLYAGAVLGPRWGALSVALYLAQGCLGLPFFAGGRAGSAWLAAATGGYLVGFLPAAWLTGMLAGRGWARSPWTAMAMMGLGSLVVFAFGLAVLSRFVPSDKLLAAGLWPFLPGDLVKMGLSAAALPLWSRWKE